MTSHTRKWKEQQVQELTTLFKENPVIAVASLERFPANLFQKIRKQLKDKATIKVSKTKVVQKALNEAKINGGEKLTENISGSVAIIFTQMNPFELYSFLKRNKGDAPAKAGVEAPNDIVITARDTGLPPGPALTDLKAAGLNVRPQGATIHIVEDKVVAKKGDIITDAVASCLSKLDIKPMKIGLDLECALEKGEVFRTETLDIDTDQVFSNFVSAHSQAFNLAFNIAYVTPDNAMILIQKAHSEAFNLSVEAGIVNSESVKLLLSKANAQASALKSKVPETVATEEPKESAEESKTEEKTEKKPEETQKEEEKTAEEKSDA